jgi:hypothetical protein
LELSHFVPVGILIAGLILKSLLDFQIMPSIVKWFHLLPVRNVFRSRPYKISGDWDQYWDVASPVYSEKSDRMSLTKIFQLDKYCYAEFGSIKNRYAVYGRVNNGFLVGEWYDLEDSHGYYGAFELEIKNKNEMLGKWIGHSKNERGVKTGEWSWKRNHSALKID